MKQFIPVSLPIFMSVVRFQELYKKLYGQDLTNDETIGMMADLSINSLLVSEAAKHSKRSIKLTIREN